MANAVRQLPRILAMCAAISLWNVPLQAADRTARDSGTAWDATINTLLATGMYGINSSMLEGVTVHFQKADSGLSTLQYARSPLSTQAITFSYQGSSSLLEFSAGYECTP